MRYIWLCKDCTPANTEALTMVKENSPCEICKESAFLQLFKVSLVQRKLREPCFKTDCREQS